VWSVIVRQENTGADRYAWHIDGGPSSPEIGSVRVFETPDGWTTAESNLTALEPGVSYVVTVVPGIGHLVGGRVHGRRPGRAVRRQGPGQGRTLNKPAQLTMDEFAKVARRTAR
jgi:hypothetical protein